MLLRIGGCLSRADVGVADNALAASALRAPPISGSPDTDIQADEPATVVIAGHAHDLGGYESPESSGRHRRPIADVKFAGCCDVKAGRPMIEANNRSMSGHGPGRGSGAGPGWEGQRLIARSGRFVGSGIAKDLAPGRTACLG